ncbi:MAG: class I SAM-dependent methyltransferase [Chloroflexota bacterium]
MGLLNNLFGGWRRHVGMSAELANYINQVSVRDTAVKQRLRQETSQMQYGDMQLGQNQAQFLGLLVQLINAQRTIEVGVFTGYSTLCTALALPENGRVVACDVSEDWTSIGQRYWAEAGVAQKIDLQIGPASATLQRLLDENEAGTYDFAFIDADKTGYDIYYEQCLKLIRPGGLIAIDNVLWGGAVANASRQDADTSALRALNAKIHADSRVDLTLVPIGDGLMLARKR